MSTKFDELKRRMVLARGTNVKNNLPWDSFLEKVKSAESLINFVEGEEEGLEAVKNARWFSVVMLVSAMEIYFKGMVDIFVEGGWFKDSIGELLKEEKITLLDLIEINKKKFTLGEIISNLKSFQNLNLINNFYSKMIGCKDFIEEVGLFRAPRGKGQYFVLNERHPTYREDINNLSRLRQLVIHHDVSGMDISEKNLEKMTDSLVDFVYAAEFYLDKISDNYTEKPPK